MHIYYLANNRAAAAATAKGSNCEAGTAVGAATAEAAAAGVGNNAGLYPVAVEDMTEADTAVGCAFTG